MLSNLSLGHRIPLETLELKRAGHVGTTREVIEQRMVRVDDAAKHRLQAEPVTAEEGIVEPSARDAVGGGTVVPVGLAYEAFVGGGRVIELLGRYSSVHVVVDPLDDIPTGDADLGIACLNLKLPWYAPTKDTHRLHAGPCCRCVTSLGPGTMPWVTGSLTLRSWEEHVPLQVWSVFGSVWWGCE